MLPLLYWKIKKIYDKKVNIPSSLLTGIRESFLKAEYSNIVLENQLKDINEALLNSGIQFLVLKGPALGRYIYPHPALRSVSDIDLLIYPGQFIEARKVLKTLGYQCSMERFNQWNNIMSEETFMVHNDNKAIFPVDMHWNIHSFYRTKEDDLIKNLFNTSISVNTTDFTFKSLDTVNSIIYTAVHLSFIHTQQFFLKWLYDIALLSKTLNSDSDWGKLSERALKWEASLALKDILTIVSQWLYIEYPVDYNKVLQDSGWSGLDKPIKRFGLYWKNSFGIVEKMRLLYHFFINYQSSEGKRFNSFTVYRKRLVNWIKRS